MHIFKVMVIQAMKKVDYHQRTMIWTILGQIKEAMMKVTRKNKILSRTVHQTQMGKVATVLRRLLRPSGGVKGFLAAASKVNQTFKKCY